MWSWSFSIVAACFDISPLPFHVNHGIFEWRRYIYDRFWVYFFLHKSDINTCSSHFWHICPRFFLLPLGTVTIVIVIIMVVIIFFILCIFILTAVKGGQYGIFNVRLLPYYTYSACYCYIQCMQHWWVCKCNSDSEQVPLPGECTSV